MNLWSRVVDRLSLLVILFIYLDATNFLAAEDVCSTEVCNSRAIAIRQYMNQDVDPCDNFYQYVCGNYGNDPMTIIFGYDISVFGDAGTDIAPTIQHYLENNGDDKKNEPFQQAFDLFAVCADQEALKEQGLDPLREIINEIGGWPLVDGLEWKETRWENATRALTELGFDSSIFFNVQIAQIIGPTIQLNPASIKEFSPFVWNKVMSVAEKMGADPDTLPAAESRDHLHNVDRSTVHDSTGYMTVDEMIKRWPEIDWITYFEGVFAGVSDVELKGDQGVIVTPDYINDVVALLKQTPTAVVMNYVAAKVVEYSLDYISPEAAADPKRKIKSTEQPQPQRNARCAYIATREMPLMIEALFQVNYVDDELNNRIRNLSFELRDQLQTLIGDADWLDEFSKDLCFTKLGELKVQLGFPEDIENGYYTEDYEGMEIDKNSYLRSILNIQRVKTTNKYEKSIANDNSVKGNRMKITSVNAQYNNDLNQMSIMPGILQNPFYEKGVPMYLNYGGIGFVLGHETVHGYDYEDKIFSESSGDEAQEKSKRDFEERNDCVSKQFEDYVKETWDLEIDGHKFTRENIADDGGSKIGFNAYKKWADENSDEPALPGFNHNNLQMYWVALAHSVCGKYNPNMVAALLQEDSHGLHEFRVNAPFSNNPDFAKTFNCPSGSAMNPEDRCVIW